MQTITIKYSAREFCSPLTVNKLISEVRKTGIDVFWPRLVSDKSKNTGKRIGVKVDSDNLEFLRALKRQIREVYGIFVSYSMLICVLGSLYGKPKERKIISLNVKGYKASTKEFKARLKDIASILAKELPDIVFLQEFKAGEEEVFLGLLKKELKGYYEPVMPKSYKKEEEFSYCTCMILLRRDMVARTRRLHGEGAGFKLRYNLVEIEDFIFLNAWIPQTFDQKGGLKELAEAMWKDVSDTAIYYSRLHQNFCLVGDLNASINGVFDEKIRTLHYHLSDTKILDDSNHPTGVATMLDYVFANKYAMQSNMIRTKIMDPSIKQAGLSDHDALVTSILAV